jgi:hypothetical protein
MTLEDLENFKIRIFFFKIYEDFDEAYVNMIDEK